MRRMLAMLLLALGLMPAIAADRAAYVNDRYGYLIDLPQGFSPIREASNGDGGRSFSADRRAELLVWGSTLLAQSFRTDVSARVDADTFEGWNVSYRRDTPRWASWSGTKGDRLFYSRAIPLCRDAAAYFRLEYDVSAKKDYDAVVEQLVKQFKATTCD